MNTQTQTGVKFEQVTKTKVTLGNAPVQVTIQPKKLLLNIILISLALAFGWQAIDWLLTPAVEVVYAIQGIFAFCLIRFVARPMIVKLVLTAVPPVAQQQASPPQ